MVEELNLHRFKLESLVEARTNKLLESQAAMEDLTAQLRSSYEATKEAILVLGSDGALITANQRFMQFSMLIRASFKGRNPAPPGRKTFSHVLRSELTSRRNGGATRATPT